MASSGFQALPMLLSVSMAISAADETEDSQPSPYVVKNTFIDVLDGTVPTLPCRSRSAPPTQRKGSSEFVEDVPAVVRLGSPARPKEDGSSCTASTSSWHEDESSLCTEENESIASDSTSDCTDPDSKAFPIPAAEKAVFLPMQTPAYAGPAPESAGADSEGAPVRSKLNSKAKVWTPKQPMVAKPYAPPATRSQLEMVIAAGQAQFKNFAFVHDVTRADGISRSAVIAKIHGQHLPTVQHVLSRVKGAVLAAAERSHQVYVIGFEAAPFRPCSGGFGIMAQLAIVPDETSTCWDLLKTGFCRRGCACRWQHPSWQTTVSFEVMCSQ